MVSRTYNPAFGSVSDSDRVPTNHFSLDAAIVVLGLTLIVIPFAILAVYFTDMNRADSAREALVPTLTEQQYVAYHRMLGAELAAPAGPMGHFFKIHNDIEKLEPLRDKFLRFGAVRPVRESMPYIQEMLASDGLWKKYVARYGEKAMHDAVDKRLTHELYPFPAARNVPAYAGSFALKAYGLSVLIAMLFFVARIWREGHTLRRELFNILTYSLIWPVKVWTYPSNIDPMESAKRFLRFAAYVLSAALSFGSVGGAFAKANQRSAYESDTSDASANTYVLDSLPEIPMPKLTIILGIESQKLIGNGKDVQQNPVAYQDAVAVWNDGWSFDFGSTESLGLNTSDERDYTLKKVWALSLGQSLITGFGYYDIQPVASTKGGDVANPFAEYDVTIGRGLTAYARGDAYFITSGPNGRDGFLTQLGLRESGIKLPLGFELGAKASVLYEKGPFRAKPGLWTRGDLALTHPVFDGRATLGIGFTGFVPLMAANGRSADHSVQATLSVPLN